MIEINNITVEYDRPLYKKQSILLKPNEITLIKGPSGSGKTTLLYIIGMLIKPKGCVYKYNSQPIKDKKRYQRNISYVMQNNDLIDYLTVEEHFHLSTSQQNISEDEMNDILKYVDLEISLDQKIDSLSTGERQRLAIAIALSNNTSMILLDEPTAYLDKERSDSVMKLLTKIAGENKSVVIVSHDKNIEPYASTIYSIWDNKIHLDKESDNDNKMEISENKMNTHYYKIYLGYYIKHHKLPIILNILFISLCVTFLILSTSLTDKFLDQQDKNLQNLSTNQVLMINSKMKSYDEEAAILDKNIINNINQIDGIKDIYPYKESYISYGAIHIVICPYYDKNNFNDYIDIQFDYSRQYFMSDALYRVIKQDVLEVYNKKYEFAGVLKKGYNASYNNENKYIIYVPSDEVDYDTGNYIVIFDDYKKIDTLSQRLKNNYNVNILNKEDSSMLLESYLLAKMMGNMACLIIFVISIVFLFIINYQTIRNQRHAFAFLKVNSVNYRKIEMTHYLFLVIESIVVWVLFIIIQIIYIQIINSIYQIHISGITSIDTAFLFIILFMFIVNIPTILGIHFNNPIKALR